MRIDAGVCARSRVACQRGHELRAQKVIGVRQDAAKYRDALTALGDAAPAFRNPCVVLTSLVMHCT